MTACRSWCSMRPPIYDRDGGPYVDATGKDYPDNWHRFAALSLAGAEIAAGMMPDWSPDLVHVHDWQAALIAGLHALLPDAGTAERPDHPQHRLSGPVRRRYLPGSAPAARTPSPSKASNITAMSAS